MKISVFLMGLLLFAGGLLASGCSSSSETNDDNDTDVTITPAAENTENKRGTQSGGPSVRDGKVLVRNRTMAEVIVRFEGGPSPGLEDDYHVGGIVEDAPLPKGRFDMIINIDTPVNSRSDRPKARAEAYVKFTKTMEVRYGLSIKRTRRNVEVWVLQAPGGTTKGLSPHKGRWANTHKYQTGQMNNDLVSINGTMDQLVRFLECSSDRRVLDETGIEGRWDFRVPNWSSKWHESEELQLTPTCLTLSRKKRTIDVVVISQKGS